MRKVLLVNQCAGYLMMDIVNAFVASNLFESVVLATGSDKKKFGYLDQKVEFQPISEYKATSTISRFFSWIKAFIQLVFLCWFKYREYELFLISNPPIDSFLHIFCRNKYSTLIYDVYPDGLGNFASKKSLIYRLWVKNNINFYKNAQAVYTLTESMKIALTQYCSKDKIQVVPIWADSSVIRPQENSVNPFINAHEELRGKFIIMYSGNIGLDHDLTCLVEAMESLRNDRVRLVIIGEGYNKKPLQDLVKMKKLEDKCLFYPYQPKEILNYSLSSAQIGIVATKPNGRSSSIPSKAFNLMKLEVPILCIAHPESEISILVEKHNIGMSFMTNQAKEITSFIEGVSKNPSILDAYRRNEILCAPFYTKELAKKFIR